MPAQNDPVDQPAPDLPPNHCRAEELRDAKRTPGRNTHQGAHRRKHVKVDFGKDDARQDVCGQTPAERPARVGQPPIEPDDRRGQQSPDSRTAQDKCESHRASDWSQMPATQKAFRRRYIPGRRSAPVPTICWHRRPINVVCVRTGSAMLHSLVVVFAAITSSLISPGLP